MKTLAFLFFFSIGFSVSGADFELSSTFKKAYDEAFRLEVNSSKSTLLGLKESDPFRIYLESYLNFIYAFNSDEEALFNVFTEAETNRLRAIEKLDAKSPYNRFLRSEMLLQSAILKLKFGREMKGAYSVVNASKLLNANQQEYPEFLPNYKSLGSLHVIIGSIPDNYKWVLKMLGLKGSVREGLKELEAASKDKVWGNEALYSSFFLKTFTARFTENDNAALLRYVKSRPNDLNAHFLGTSISLRNQKANQSLAILEQKPIGKEFLVCPIFELHQGDSFLMKGMYKQSIVSFQKYLKSYRGKAYVKDAHLKLYFAHLIENESDKAAFYFRKIPAVGNNNSDFDKTADTYFKLLNKSKSLPLPQLLQARFYIDGGFYKKGLSVLENISNEQNIAELEADYHFLVGVAHHELGNKPQAISSFKKAILLSDNLNWNGTGANSALYLGYAYQESKQNAQAKSFFEKALSYKGHELKNSVDTKARAALTELKIPS